MRAKYIVAALAGMLIGFVALVSCAMFSWGINSLEIPTSWNEIKYRIFLPPLYKPGIGSVMQDERLTFDSPSNVLTLQRKALGLKVCSLLLERGLAFLAPPAFALCALIRLSALGERNRWLKFCADSCWLVLVWTIGWWALGFVNTKTSSLIKTAPDLLLFVGLKNGLFLLGVAIILVPIVLGVFWLVQLVLYAERRRDEVPSVKL